MQFAAVELPAGAIEFIGQSVQPVALPVLNVFSAHSSHSADPAPDHSEHVVSENGVAQGLRTKD